MSCHKIGTWKDLSHSRRDIAITIKHSEGHTRIIYVNERVIDKRPFYPVKFIDTGDPVALVYLKQFM